MNQDEGGSTMSESCCPTGEDKKKSTKGDAIKLAGAGGSLGLAAAAGACATGCGAAFAPVAAFLSSIGLGALSGVLPVLRIPLLIVAVVLGGFAIRGFVRRGEALKSAAAGCLLGGGLLFAGWQMLQPAPCAARGPIEQTLQKMTPESKRVIQDGLYALWPRLGRAPTLAEIQTELKLASEDAVLGAFEELETLGYQGIFYPGTKRIRWFWPLSSENHGVEVTLLGAKPVHARCAIDALGMSSMFGKPAKITVMTPQDHRPLDLEIDGNRLVKADPAIVVSHRPDDCDSMLFFASMEEFERYRKASGKMNLNVFPLTRALERGIASFGWVLKT
jgi:hypothetical protein